MSAQKPDACILNTLNHYLRANEYTNLHKNNDLPPLNGVRLAGFYWSVLGNVRTSVIFGIVEWNMNVWKTVFYDPS